MKQKCDNPNCSKVLEYKDEGKKEAAAKAGWMKSGLAGHYLCPLCYVKLQKGLAAAELEKITEKLRSLTEELTELQKGGTCE